MNACSFTARSLALRSSMPTQRLVCTSCDCNITSYIPIPYTICNGLGLKISVCLKNAFDVILIFTF